MIINKLILKYLIFRLSKNDVIKKLILKYIGKTLNKMKYSNEIPSELEYGNRLYSRGILPGPIICSCKSTSFKIYYVKLYQPLLIYIC